MVDDVERGTVSIAIVRLYHTYTSLVETDYTLAVHIVIGLIIMQDIHDDLSVLTCIQINDNHCRAFGTTIMIFNLLNLLCCIILLCQTHQVL